LLPAASTYAVFLQQFVNLNTGNPGFGKHFLELFPLFFEAQIQRIGAFPGLFRKSKPPMQAQITGRTKKPEPLVIGMDR
jgi:hypothetical protein